MCIKAKPHRTELQTCIELHSRFNLRLVKMFLAVLVPVGLLLLLAVVINLIISRRKVKNVPHPRIFPIIGNGHLFINNTPSGIVLLIKDLLKQHGKRFQVVLGMDLVLFTADVKDFEVSIF